MRHEDLAGRNCAKCCFSIVLWLRWLGKSAPKNGRVRRICCPRRGKICTTLWRESDSKSKSLKNTRVSDHFLRFKVLFAWQAHGFRHSIHIKIAKTISKTYIVILTSSVWSACHVSGKSRRKVSWSVSQLVSQLVG